MWNIDIKNSNKYTVSNSTINRWIEKGEKEVKENTSAKRLFDSIDYIWF